VLDREADENIVIFRQNALQLSENGLWCLLKVSAFKSRVTDSVLNSDVFVNVRFSQRQTALARRCQHFLAHVQFPKERIDWIFDHLNAFARLRLSQIHPHPKLHLRGALLTHWLLL